MSTNPKKKKNDYRPNMVAFMNYMDGPSYTIANFTGVVGERLKGRLRRLTPDDVVKYFSWRTYGVPDNEDENAIARVRKSSLDYWKKSISAFMPDNGHDWQPVTKFGNPTRSHEVRQFIAKVQRKQCRGQGQEPKARRAATSNEMTQTQTLLRESPESGNVTRYGVPALNNFQAQMLSRVDCATQWQHVNFEPHPRFVFAARARLAWSKNVNEERDAPWKILLGGMDPVHCVLIGLAIWLEYYLTNWKQNPSPYVFAFNNNVSVPEGGEKANDFVRKQMSNVFKSDDFIADGDEKLLGTYSVRKYAKTNSRRLIGGCS